MPSCVCIKGNVAVMGSSKVLELRRHTNGGKWVFKDGWVCMLTQ